MEAHNQAVSKISDDIKSFYNHQVPFRIYHGSTNSTRKSQYQRSQMIDTSLLNHVLKIDTSSMIALVEPNVPMDSLVQASLQHGLVPPVIMEFPGITVGGGFAGTAGESSSFKYGFFDRTVNWIEMVLANGDIVKASATENSDLFYGAASSFGTLGVTTLLEVQLIQAKTYVALTYIPITSINSAVSEISKASKDTTVDYLDGIMFSPTYGVVCSGRLTSSPQPGNKIQSFTRRYDPWFYTHVSRLMASSSTPVTEYVPLQSYLFRYDRGGFWVARYAYKYFLTPFNRITRFILDYYMHTRVMYHALHQSGLASKYIIQDVAIPYNNTEHFMDYLDVKFTHYPIWICPLKQSGTLPNATHTLKAQLKTQKELPDFMLNFGVWGPGPTDRKEFVAWNRAFESKVEELGGQKWLYAHTYYTEAEFNDIYDTKAYHELRKKYHADHLPTVYDKVKVDHEREERERRAKMAEGWWAWLSVIFWSLWPFQGLYGVWAAFRGGEYLLPPKDRKEVEAKKRL